MPSPGPDTGSHIVSSPQLWLSASGLYMTTIVSSLLMNGGGVHGVLPLSAELLASGRF